MSRLADVVIPTFNDKPEHLRAAVTSSLACEEVSRVVVVDDGSSVPAAQVLLELTQSQGADRLVLIRQDNAGVSTARNLALERVQAEYTVLLDADDELLPGLSDALALADATQAGLVVSARVTFDDSGFEEFKPVPPEWGGRVLDHPSAVFRPIVLFSTPGTVVRTSLITGGLRFDPSVQCYSDKVFFREAGERGPIAVCPSAVSRYRLHPDGSNMSGRKQLDPRVDEHLLVMSRWHEPECDGYWCEATVWLVNQYAKFGSDRTRWERLTAEMARRGWGVPLKARARFTARKTRGQLIAR